MYYITLERGWVKCDKVLHKGMEGADSDCVFFVVCTSFFVGSGGGVWCECYVIWGEGLGQVITGTKYFKLVRTYQNL